MLRCKCGGEVRAIDVNENEYSAFERYKCQDCGSEGNMVTDFTTNSKTLWGCLKEVV